MKMLLVFPFILLTQVGPNRVISPFESISISPLYTNKETKIEVRAKSKNLRIMLYIQNDKYSSQCCLDETIASSGRHIFTYRNEYTRLKNKVFIRYATGSNYVDSPTVDRNTSRGSYRTISNNEGFSSSSTVAILKPNLTWETKQIDYTLHGFDGLYVPKYYHKIDFDDFYIETDPDYPSFFDCSPSFVMKNYNHYFDNITNANETVTFNLECEEAVNEFYFKFANDMYVHPETLLMSSTQKEGYVKTNFLYLPINEIQNQEKFECYFMLQNFGIDKDAVLYPFEIRALSNIFGNCNNSRYCILRSDL